MKMSGLLYQNTRCYKSLRKQFMGVPDGGRQTENLLFVNFDEPNSVFGGDVERAPKHPAWVTWSRSVVIPAGRIAGHEPEYPGPTSGRLSQIISSPPSRRVRREVKLLPREQVLPRP